MTAINANGDRVVLSIVVTVKLFHCKITIVQMEVNLQLFLYYVFCDINPWRLLLCFLVISAIKKNYRLLKQFVHNAITQIAEHGTNIDDVISQLCF